MCFVDFHVVFRELLMVCMCISLIVNDDSVLFLSIFHVFVDDFYVFHICLLMFMCCLFMFHMLVLLMFMCCSLACC